MKDTHDTHILGAVWFKHKYPTNQAVTSEERIIAAIGGQAKTLRTNIPPQLHDNSVDKLQKLQDVLQPRPDGRFKNIPIQTPAQVPRVRTPYKYAPDHSPVQTPNATAPRVAINYAIPPRVAPVETNLDLPPERPTSPQQSLQLEALQKQSSVGEQVVTNKEVEIWNQCKEVEIWDQSPTKDRQVRTNSTPAQNTRSKTAGDWPTIKERCEVRTIEQKLVLACIQTYTEVTQKPIQASSLAQRKFPSKILNAVLNKDTGELMEMQQLLRNPKYSNLWGKSYTKELGRLAQGIPGTKGTDTIMFIEYNEIPLDQRWNVTYGKNGGHVSARKGQPKSNKAHSRWQSNSLPV